MTGACNGQCSGLIPGTGGTCEATGRTASAVPDAFKSRADSSKPLTVLFWANKLFFPVYKTLTPDSFNQLANKQRSGAFSGDPAFVGKSFSTYPAARLEATSKRYRVASIAIKVRSAGLIEVLVVHRTRFNNFTRQVYSF